MLFPATVAIYGDTHTYWVVNDDDFLLFELIEISYICERKMAHPVALEMFAEP